ncbi:MAG: gamma-glutamylcyclotransferase family protein [Prochlorococcaceae cyanobacterium]|jgi:gamma-glutamylcyclotransferase (GGCT)/AIG2-like uncharacterized protein YtfP
MNQHPMQSHYPHSHPGGQPAGVLVYGTLRRGQRNHHWLAEGSRFLGEAQLADVLLYDLGPFPMAVRLEDLQREGAAVPPAPQPLQGELYAVDGAALARLDQLEGTPRLYTRAVLPLLDGRRAWIYLGRPRQVRHARLLAAGSWREGGSRRLQRPGPGALLAAAALLATCSPAPVAVLHAAVLQADLRQDCLQWQQSHGSARVALANRIGAEQLLTKNHRLAESGSDAPTSLYRQADLVRVCRNA